MQQSASLEPPSAGAHALPTAFLDLLTSLIRSPSVVGAEHSFFRVLQRELEERGARVTWYEGLLVAQGSRPDSTMFSAHIDRHGLVCTGPNEFQYAAFVAGARSDLLGNSVDEQLMKKIVNRFEAQLSIIHDSPEGSVGYVGMEACGIPAALQNCPPRRIAMPTLRPAPVGMVVEMRAERTLQAETRFVFQAFNHVELVDKLIGGSE